MQVRQFVKAIREEAWRDVEILRMADQAEDILENVMRRGNELSGLINSYLGREFNLLKRLRLSRDMLPIQTMVGPEILKKI